MIKRLYAKIKGKRRLQWSRPFIENKSILEASESEETINKYISPLFAYIRTNHTIKSTISKKEK